ncbi:MAG TPA: helix-turn-helix transcriptional regulator, partial [Anaeromyxobacteraceae bacterium]|nr:helix-turn-helix transcriptional regulator [Anaeromyxobacteraceae bacterium]
GGEALGAPTKAMAMLEAARALQALPLARIEPVVRLVGPTAPAAMAERPILLTEVVVPPAVERTAHAAPPTVAEPTAHAAPPAAPEPTADVAPPTAGEGSADAAPREFVPPSDGRWSGDALRAARESAGFTLTQLADRTKVTRYHLEHIEGELYDRLPSYVYLRGILLTVARELRLDGNRVARSYLELAQHAAEERSRV